MSYSSLQNSVSDALPSMEMLIQEIQQTPPTQWRDLLQILKLFRQSVAVQNAEISPKNQAAIDLLRTWRETDDAQEQQETWAFLKQALDEDRLGDRPLFSQ